MFNYPLQLPLDSPILLSSRTDRFVHVRGLLGLHAMLQLDVMSNGQLASNFILIAPKSRLLVVKCATYGHPKGQSQQGRMSVDVQEIIQGIIDAGMSGGSYLTISHMAPVKRTFGDPCPGYPKDLRIAFEVCGRSGEIIEVGTHNSMTSRFLQDS